MGNVQNGGRKLADGQQTLIALTLGFAFAAWTSAPTELYYAFAAAAVGKSGIFNWGNSNEHKAKAPTQAQSNTPA